MTIDSRYFPEQYTTGEGFTEYPFDFEVIDESYVEVFAGEGVSRTQLVLNTDYTVELSAYRAPISKNGVVVLTTPLSAGQTLWIERKTNIAREAAQDAVAGEPMNVEALEFDMDKLTMIMQELEGHFCSCQECLAPDVVVEVYGDAQQLTPVDGIVTIPSSVTSVELRAVIQAGTSPFTYQWTRRGDVMAGETGSSVTFTPSFAENGATYAVTVGNTCGSRTDVVQLEIAVEGITPGKACDAIEVAANVNLEHFWPMDDPQFMATVPADWRRTKGSEYRLTNNRNVGVSWTGGAMTTWTVNGEVLGTFSLCDNDAEYVQHVYDTIPHHSTLNDYNAFQQFEDNGFWTTYLVTETEALGFVHDHNIDFLRSGSQTISMNPRITVTRDAGTQEMVFTSSLNGGQEVLRVPYNTSYKIHAITIKSPVYQWVNLGNGTFDFSPTYEIQVDDGSPVPFNFSVVTPFSASSFAFQGWDYIRPFRGGRASWLGVGFNVLTDPHPAMWAAIVANHP